MGTPVWADQWIYLESLWTLTHGQTMLTYIHQLCEDNGYCLDILTKAIADRDGWWERVKESVPSAHLDNERAPIWFHNELCTKLSGMINYKKQSFTSLCLKAINHFKRINWNKIMWREKSLDLHGISKTKKKKKKANISLKKEIRWNYQEGDRCERLNSDRPV